LDDGWLDDGLLDGGLLNGVLLDDGICLLRSCRAAKIVSSRHDD